MGCFDICFPVCETRFGFDMGVLFWILLIAGAFIALIALILALRIGNYKIVKRVDEK